MVKQLKGLAPPPHLHSIPESSGLAHRMPGAGEGISRRQCWCAQGTKVSGQNSYSYGTVCLAAC
jgi:hypothetical protein